MGRGWLFFLDRALLRYVNTLVLLASLPAFPSAAHDPAHWMDQLIAVANKSRETMSMHLERTYTYMNVAIGTH